MSSPEKDNTPLTQDPAYRDEKETWHDAGCLPENGFVDKLNRLVEDVKAGLVSEAERRMTEQNAKGLMDLGKISPYIYQQVRKAVKIDESGNLEKN
jgi:hypothetical protein